MLLAAITGEKREDLSFHAFPKDPTQHAGKCKGFAILVTPNTILCSEHCNKSNFYQFVELESLTSKRTCHCLLPGGVPSIFSYHPVHSPRVSLDDHRKWPKFGRRSTSEAKHQRSRVNLSGSTNAELSCTPRAIQTRKFHGSSLS